MNMYTFIFLFNIVKILIHLLCENVMYITVANAHIQQLNVNEFYDSLLHIWLCIFFISKIPLRRYKRSKLSSFLQIIKTFPGFICCRQFQNFSSDIICGLQKSSENRRKIMKRTKNICPGYGSSKFV